LLRKEAEMSVMHESRTGWLRIPEVWTSLAIAVMWTAVVVDAIWGPDITSETPGGTTTHVPSAVAVALFAMVASWAVARYTARKN
jgi:hypothetical protein